MNPDNPKNPFENLFTSFFADTLEQIKLATECKMRRFYLVRNEDVDPDKVSGTGVIAEGIVYEDGTVSMRWKTKYKSTVIYESIEDVQAIHGHNGKTVVKFVDAEKML